jgi:hypothetical protein
MTDKIKILVTQEKFDEHFSIDDWFHFSDLTQRELYEKLLLFVVDEEGNPVTVEEARAMFKKVPKKEWLEYIASFMTGVKDAFVNPTNGGS